MAQEPDRLIPLDPLFTPSTLRVRNIYMLTLPEDRIALSQALLRIFPTMRFLAFGSGFRWNRTDVAWGGLRRLRYIEHLYREEIENIGGWIEPPGWKPHWRPPSRDEEFTMYQDALVNVPKLHFDFCTSIRNPADLGKHSERCFIFTWVTVGDAETVSFANGIARAVRSVASNWWQWVGKVEEAGSVEPEPPKRKNTYLGHHARALFDADPSRRFWGGFRPADPPGRRAKKA